MIVPVELLSHGLVGSSSLRGGLTNRPARPNSAVALDMVLGRGRRVSPPPET